MKIIIYKLLSVNDLIVKLAQLAEYVVEHGCVLYVYKGEVPPPRLDEEWLVEKAKDFKIKLVWADGVAIEALRRGHLFLNEEIIETVQEGAIIEYEVCVEVPKRRQMYMERSVAAPLIRKIPHLERGGLSKGWQNKNYRIQ